jgi:hypothetical protein
MPALDIIILAFLAGLAAFGLAVLFAYLFPLSDDGEDSDKSV